MSAGASSRLVWRCLFFSRVASLTAIVVGNLVLFGWLRLQGQYSGLYGTEFGVALFAVPNIALLMVVVWLTASSLKQTDAERKQTEETLRQNEELFRAFMDHTPALAVLKDAEGRYVYFNKPYQMQILRSQMSTGWLGKLDVDMLSPEIIGKVRADDLTVLTTTATIPISTTIALDNSTQQWAGFKFPVHLPTGELLVGGVSVDVTERVRIEETLQLQARALESLSEGIVVVDEQGVIVFTNPAFDVMFGYKRGELLERHISGLNDPTTDDIRTAGLLLDELHCVGTWTGEIKSQKKDGTSFLSFARISTLTLPSNKRYWVTIQEDISERKQAEQKLRVSEERYRIVSQSISDYAFSFRVAEDGEISIEWLTESFSKVTGYSVAEIIHAPNARATYIHPDDFGRVTQTLRSLRPGASTGYELRIIRKDGAVRWLQSQVQGIGDHEGKIIRVCGAVQDITERKRAEEALRESEERYRILNQVISDYAFSLRFEADGTPSYEWLTESFTKVIGYTIAEALSNPNLLRQYIHPEDLERINTIFSRLVPGTTTSYEFRLIRRDGSLGWLRSYIQPLFDEQGRLTRIYGATQDITEHKQAEDALRESQARLARIINSAMDAIITVNEAQDILLFNPAAERMFRYQTSEIIGQPLDRLIPERVRSVHREHVQHFGQTRTSMLMGVSGSLSGLRADGEEFPIEASISQVVVAGEKTYTVILRDITERQHAMHAIRTLNAELEQRVKARTAELTAANKEMEAFSSSVSHDLRAPLRNVLGFVELLTKSAGPQLTGEAQRHLTIITEETKRMGVLIDALLTFSRVGRVELQKTTVNLTSLCQAVRESLRMETQGRDIAWHIGPLPEVYADRVLLRQVLVNLLANAVKFTHPRAQAKIEIGAMPTPATDPMVVVFVRDNGVGFDMKYVDKLFNVFQRLHRREEFEGTGVGLANVQRIVQRHGGRVWVEAAVDQGATFFVALPKQ